MGKGKHTPGEGLADLTTLYSQKQSKREVSKAGAIEKRSTLMGARLQLDWRNKF